jgi:GNAT superfamily N-acetyltransferase
MINVREAGPADAPAVCAIFRACYGEDYPYPQFYDLQLLTRTIYSDDTMLLVAEDSITGQVVGTASVILEAGAYSDLVGEFGRLAVHPEARNQGVGRLLLAERLRRVQDRLHVGLIEGRVSHPYTLRIAEAQDFAVVGFLPLKLLLRTRESLALLVRHFGSGLELRKNHPRIIPEAYPLAYLGLRNCSLAVDVVVDEESAPYPAAEDFAIEELTTEGYTALLRIERGRVRNREVFGPLRLHYGFFKIRARHANYLVAREGGRVAGAVGFIVDALEKAVSIFELIALHDHVLRFLLAEVERRCREVLEACYLEADVSPHAPRMQRTLLELNFLPAAYVPALAFHEVERLDVVRMVRLLAPLDLGPMTLSPATQEVADIVLNGFASRQILPRIAGAVRHLALFAGLNAEQVHRLAGVCGVRSFEPGVAIFSQGQLERELYLVLDGEADVTVAGARTAVGRVHAGECLGELALLTAAPHSATVTARSRVEAAVLKHQDLTELARRRPDIGMTIYRNLALDVGKKLRRADASLGSAAPPELLG